MTVTEFSNEFDILYNNIMSNSAPGLNEYEKSVFLTQAQEAVILGIYNGTFSGDSFESTEESSEFLNPLVKQEVLVTTVKRKGLSENSIFYNIPESLWFITYESVILSDPALGCKDKSEVTVIPITQDLYSRIKENPFRNASKNRVLRLVIGNTIELISKYNIESYLIRYLSRPKPIILENLSDFGVTIDGYTGVSECKLSTALHNIILEKAVQLAKLAWSGK